MYTLQHYIHRIYAIMFYMTHDCSYKLYIESKVKQAISLKWLVTYDVEILWRFEHIIISTDSILNTSNNSDICAHKGKLNIYLNIFLYATCNLYTAIWSTLITPIPYNSIGKHFLTTSSRLIVSERSEELSKTSYAAALNFFILSSISIYS